MRRRITVAWLLLIAPAIGLAQTGQGNGAVGTLNSLHKVLDGIYNKLMPLSSQLISVCMGLAGFGALWYIAYRVWGHLARAESIDFYPLFRPFVLGFCILNFPLLISLINTVMKPTVTGTAGMVDNADKAMVTMLKLRDSAIRKSEVWDMYVGPTGEGNREKWYKYTHEKESPGTPLPSENFFESIGNDVRFMMAKVGYSMRYVIKMAIAEILQLLFAAVALCINTLRTFNLVILAIIGPLVLGISVFDGFQHTMKHWLARYLNVFLWLPVANIFGSVMATIQVEMLKIDLGQIQQTGDTFFTSTDLGYMVFLIIGIYGYTTVPTIANHIVWVTGADMLTSRVTNAAGNVTNMATSGTAEALSRMHQKISGG
ncbi:MAG: conjugative transposon protein TraJ [Pseudobacter sp.]|uniref:conjugative transposon protein TraJ n=1 Tax=Pseudobacter sp. TaxID=2045420 RepID=UPI003F7F746A